MHSLLQWAFFFGAVVIALAGKSNPDCQVRRPSGWCNLQDCNCATKSECLNLNIGLVEPKCGWSHHQYCHIRRCPATCAEAEVVNGDNVQLFFKNYHSQPWVARCHNGLEYLVVDPSLNWSKYCAGGYRQGTDILTRFHAIRLHGDTGIVTLDDFTFAVSTGAVSYTSNNVLIIIDRVRWSNAGDCRGGGACGSMNVDLTGSDFIFSPTHTFFVTCGGNGIHSAIDPQKASVSQWGGGCGDIILSNVNAGSSCPVFDTAVVLLEYKEI